MRIKERLFGLAPLSCSYLQQNKGGKEVQAMQWEFVVALAMAIPVILFPAVFIWYLNVGGIFTATKETRTRGVAHGKEANEIPTPAP